MNYTSVQLTQLEILALAPKRKNFFKNQKNCMSAKKVS